MSTIFGRDFSDRNFHVVVVRWVFPTLMGLRQDILAEGTALHSPVSEMSERSILRKNRSGHMTRHWEGD